MLPPPGGDQQAVPRTSPLEDALVARLLPRRVRGLRTAQNYDLTACVRLTRYGLSHPIQIKLLNGILALSVLLDHVWY